MCKKRILFIGPKFYDYHKVIQQELEAQGSIVDFFAERPYGLVHLILLVLGGSFYKAYSKKRYSRLLSGLATNTYDYLLVVKGDSLPESFMSTFRTTHPGCRCIMYQWDSIRSNDYLHLIPFFDRVFSFDFADCETHPGLTYQPLFYMHEIKTIRQQDKPRDIDLLILGTYLPERYRAIRKIEDYCTAQGLRLYTYLYVPRFRFFYEKFRKGVKISRKDAFFVPLSRAEVFSLYDRSKAIVDISNVRQTGLSMRVIECLAAKRKLLTTNARIQEQSFFDPGQIAIIDPGNLSIDRRFLESEVREVSPVIDALDITTWLYKLFQS